MDITEEEHIGRMSDDRILTITNWTKEHWKTTQKIMQEVEEEQARCLCKRRKKKNIIQLFI